MFTEKLEIETDPKEPLIKSSTPTGRAKKWTTPQLILICVIVVVIAGLATNMDRIVNSTKNNQQQNGDKQQPPKFEFGHKMYKYFDYDHDNGLNLNWGSFGGYPKEIRQQTVELNEQIETDVNQFYISGTRSELMNFVLQLFADLIGVQDTNDLVFVDNASHGVNAVLRSLASAVFLNQCANNGNGNSNSNSNQTCKIIQFDTAYPMVPSTLQYLGDLYANSNPFPQNHVLTFHVERAMLSDTALLTAALQKFIDENTADGQTIIHAAIFSHITPFPATLFDAKQLCSMFRANKIWCVVDAAHSLGQVHIDLTDMQPDVFIVTGYKWYFAPRGSGLMYVTPELQELIYPTIISAPKGSGDTVFRKQFSYSGTKDDMGWFAMKFAYEWREKIGGEDKIINYLHDLSVEGGKQVARIWNTSFVFDDETFIPGMATIVFPSQNLAEVGQVVYTLLFVDNIFVRIEQDTDGLVMARICAQIFLDVSDYERFAYRALQLLDQV